MGDGVGCAGDENFDLVLEKWVATCADGKRWVLEGSISVGLKHVVGYDFENLGDT